MTSLAICIPSAGGHDEAVTCLRDTMSVARDVVVYDDIEGEQAGFLAKLQRFYLESNADVLGYIHADCYVQEKGWDALVLKEFKDAKVAIAAFSGATGHGSPDIYRTPYDFRQLVRTEFRSNLTDAESHGIRSTIAQDVAVVDSFAMFLRRDFLVRCGGWPVATYPPCHCSDYWCCLMAHRLGMRVRYVPVKCHHRSGGSHLGTFDYPSWLRTTTWGDDVTCHRVGHRLLYDEFRDVLPVRVGER